MRRKKGRKRLSHSHTSIFPTSVIVVELLDILKNRAQLDLEERGLGNLDHGCVQICTRGSQAKKEVGLQIIKENSSHAIVQVTRGANREAMGRSGEEMYQAKMMREDQGVMGMKLQVLSN